MYKNKLLFLLYLLLYVFKKYIYFDVIFDEK